MGVKIPDEELKHAPTIPHEEPPAGAGPLEVAQHPGKNAISRFLRVLGPGLITGASDDDPSGIGTYAIAGAALGLSTLWMALWTLPLMISVQYISAKIGLVTGRGIAGVLRQYYSRKLLYTIVFGLAVANIINAGVDLGAIAASINLLVPTIPIGWLILPITIAILVLQIWGSYRLIARVFKWLTLALLAYVGAALLAHPDAGEVLRSTFLPSFHLDKTFIATVVAILGTTISPYLFFWQASQEVEEEISLGRKTLAERKGASQAELKYTAWDIDIGMIVSNVVMYFIILATASTLFKAGKTNIQSATEAAEALRPIAGDMARLLLAVGLTGAGILAVPVLTASSAYAISEAFGWKYGLDEKPYQAKQFYAVIATATMIGMLINFIGLNPIQALFWTSVINGFLAPPALVILMLIANNKAIMGSHVNSKAVNIFGWLTTLIMFIAAIAFVLMAAQP